MNIVQKQIPDNAEILLHGDTHIGSELTYYNGIDKLIKYVKDNNAYVIHMGDWIEAITSDDKRFQADSTKEFIPSRQADMAVELYQPIADKILVGLEGNHEYKLERFGNYAEEICRRLNIAFGGSTTKLHLYNKKSLMLKMFLTHGYRGALNSNAKDFEQQQANIKANLKRKLVHKAGDCLVMACGHYHHALVVPPAERLILSDNGKEIKQKYLKAGNGAEEYIEPDRRYYLCTGSFLKTFEIGVSGYAERAGYDPVELGYISVKLKGGVISSVDRVMI
jgi:predicted phosphodiesterase